MNKLDIILPCIEPYINSVNNTIAKSNISNTYKFGMFNHNDMDKNNSFHNTELRQILDNNKLSILNDSTIIRYIQNIIKCKQDITQLNALIKQNKIKLSQINN